MAAATLNAAEVSNAQVQTLAKVYALFQNKTDIWGWLNKMPKDEVNYLGIKVPIEISANPSLSYGTGNNDAFATAQASNFDNYTVSYVFLNQGTIETYAAYLNRNLQTSENMIEYQEESSARQFASFLNCYASRGDSTCALATVSTNYAGGTPTLAVCNGSTDSIGPSQLVTGGYYKFYNAAGTTQRTGTVGAGAIQLASKTTANAVFATDIPSDVVATDIIVPETGGTTDASAGLYGLPIIIDSTGTYYGKNRSSYNGLASYEKTSAGTLTAAMLAETFFSICQRGGWFTGDGTTSLLDQLHMICNTGNAQAYYALSLNSGAVVGSPLFLNHEGGDRPTQDIGLRNFNQTWFGAPLKVGNNVRGDEIYFSSPKELRRAVLKDVGDISGAFPASDYLQSVDGSGNWLTARIKYKDFWGNIWAPNPSRLGKISGITLTAPTQKATNVTS